MTLLHADPPVVLTTTTNIRDIPGTTTTTIESIEAALNSARRAPYYLVQPTWHFPEVVRDAPRVVEILGEVERRHGRGHVIILSNERADKVLSHQLGFVWADIHQNAFVDDSIFDSVPLGDKKYRAIYNAKLIGFKNHELASEVDNLALIYGLATGTDSDYFSKVALAMPRSHFLNGDANGTHPNLGRYRRLNHKECAESLRSSCVGLCLSHIEGAMYASMEYLMCGLPVVSVASKGGRDTFAAPDYWITCDSTPPAVAQAVEEMIRRDISAEFVRENTMRRVYEHRARLIHLMHCIQEQSGMLPTWNTNWAFLRSTHGGLRFQSPEELRREHALLLAL
jgi:glycosyltransferase involved in cell wall biosynthesis